MLSFLWEEKRQAISKDIMLVNNNNNNIFYRHFSFRLKRVFPCKCVAYYEGDCWIKICFTMCGWIDEWSRKMEMRINVCCRYENMWWNMKFIYFKLCSRSRKRHLYFRTNTKPGSEKQGCGWEFELVWICAYGWRL